MVAWSSLGGSQMKSAEVAATGVCLCAYMLWNKRALTGANATGGRDAEG